MNPSLPPPAEVKPIPEAPPTVLDPETPTDDERHCVPPLVSGPFGCEHPIVPQRQVAVDVSHDSLVGSIDGLCRSPEIQKRVASTFSADLSKKERRDMLWQRRLALRLELRKAYAQRALDVQSDLTAYLGLGPRLPRGRSNKFFCRYLGNKDQSFYETLQQDYEKELWGRGELLRKSAQALFHGGSGSDGLFGQIVYRSYEATFLDWLMRHGWQDTARKVGIAIGKDLTMPMLVPSGDGQTIFPQDQFDRIHAQYPMLGRPYRDHFFAGEAPFSQVLFAHAFIEKSQTVKQGEIDTLLIDHTRRQIEHDVVPQVTALYNELRGMDAKDVRNLILERKYALGKEEQGQSIEGIREDERLYILAWQRFLKERATAHIVARSAAAIAGKKELEGFAAKALYDIASNWHREIVQFNDDMCRENNEHEVENDPFAMSLFLNQYQGDKLYEHVDAYCNSGWGHNKSTVGKSVLKVSGYLAIGAGLVFAPYVTVPAMGASANVLAIGGGLAVGGGFLMEGLDNFSRLNLNSAIYAPSVLQRQMHRLETASDFVFAGLAPITAGVVADKVRAAGVTGLKVFYPNIWQKDGTISLMSALRVFVPLAMASGISYKKMADNGLNPLTQPGYYIDLAATYLMWSITTQGTMAEGSTLLQKIWLDGKISAAAVLAFLAVDDFIQSGKFALGGGSPDARVKEFVSKFSIVMFGNVVGQVSADHVVRLLVGKMFSESLLASKHGVWLAVGIPFAYKIFHNYAYYNFSYAAFARFLTYREMTFTEALTKMSPKDFNIFLRVNVCDDPKLEQEKAMCARMAADPFGTAEKDRLVDLGSHQLKPIQDLIKSSGDPDELAFVDAIMKARAELIPHLEEQGHFDQVRQAIEGM